MTGVSNIAEIVTTIIKTGEQHYGLYIHMNTVSAEVDTLEEVLSVSSRVITRLNHAKNTGKFQADGLLTGLQAAVSGKAKAGRETRTELVLVKAALEEALLPLQVRVM